MSTVLREVYKEKFGNDLGEPIYFVRLEYVGENSANVSNKSDKFWEVAVFPTDDGRFTVVRRWGKFGARGQIKPETAWSKHGAKRKARDMKAKKREKGYTKEIDVITRLGMLGDEEAA
jgi:predicted DNA-binding WGR domain protein